MKYAILKQIESYLHKFQKITQIYRTNDNCILLEFDGRERLFFDLNKTHSAIYKNDDFSRLKEYKAPFDLMLIRRFKSAKITGIKVFENNRILSIKTLLCGSYKELFSEIIFEFTGRFTNVILLDENSTILEALRHYENDTRIIKVGMKFTPLLPAQIREKPSVQIENFDEFFKEEFNTLNNDKICALKANKSANLEKKIAILQSNLSNLGSEKEYENLSKDLFKKGEILTANLYKIAPYEREFELLDFDGKAIKFSLDTQPKFAANELFLRAKKMRQKAQNLDKERTNLNEKIDFLKSLLNLINSTNSISEIEILMPKNPAKKMQEKFSDDICNFYIENYKISVGKSAKGNEILLNMAKKDDFWFHLKDIPSAHVIVKSNKQNLSDEIVEFAAKICIATSVKNSGKFTVDYTKRENVKIKNGAFVNYVNFKTITINFDKTC